jgi:hypothetical protein
MCFTALGADHVIANMFYIPLGIWLGGAGQEAKKLSVGTYIGKSLVPAGLGNIFGGGLFVGVLYWYIYLTGEEECLDEKSDVENGSGNLVKTTGIDAKSGSMTLRERYSPA